MRRARTGMLGGAALLAVLALLAVDCERDANAPPPAATARAAAAQRPEPDVVVAEPPPDAAAPPAAAPRDHPAEPEKPALPDDVPLYAAALPISSMSSPTRGTIVNLRSKDAVDVIAAWYAKELPARGWLIENQGGAANARLVTAMKQDRKASVLITGGSQDTQILLTVLEMH